MSHEPVVLVHGFLDTWYTPWWKYLKKYLRSEGYDDIYMVNVGNVPGTTVGSPRRYANKVRATVEQAYDSGGEVDIIAHSMGGLDSRWYIEEMNGEDYVEDLVTLSTPHRGTEVTRLIPFVSGAREMEPGSDFIRTLNEDGPAESVSYTSVWSAGDYAVFPHHRAWIPDRWTDTDVRNIKAGNYGHIGMVAKRGAFEEYKGFL